MFNFRKNQIVNEKIQQYLQVVKMTFVQFEKAMKSKLGEGKESFEELKADVLRLESQADDIRRDVERELYQKSLLPELREDLLLIIDNLDELPDLAEDIVKMIFNLKIEIPADIRVPFLELLKLSVETVNVLEKMALDMMHKTEKIEEFTNLIDNNESAADKIQDKLIGLLFEDGLNNCQQLVLRELVDKVGEICDLCQEVTDVLNLVAIKRQV